MSASASVRRWAGRALAVAAVLLVAAQAVRPARTNPPERGTILAAANAPARAILQRACLDCHSNQTTWPWYSNVAPVSWLVIHDVDEGRRELNLSEWDAQARPAQAKLLGEICEDVRQGEMPPFQYTVIHRDARLSPQDVQTLCAWTRIAQAQSSLR